MITLAEQKKLERLVDLAGINRFKKIMSVLDLNKSVEQNIYVYTVKSDCFEMSKFHDRITNKGYQRYSQDAIEFFFNDLIEVVKKFNK